MSNTWPNGNRQPITQSRHADWNALNYPGTRQMCVKCDSPTGRCEEDSLFDKDGEGPLCEECSENDERRIVIYLNQKEIEILGFITDHYRQHAERCDNISNRPMAEKQKARDLERVAVLEEIISQTTERGES